MHLILLLAQAATSLDADLLSLAKTAFAAVTSGNWWLAVSAGLFLADALAVKYAGDRFPIFKQPAVRLALICLGAGLGGLMNSLLAGAAMGSMVLLAAAKIAGAAFVAGGGWSLVQKYVLPLIASKLGAVNPEAAKAQAVEAGKAAVEKAPPPGAEGL